MCPSLFNRHLQPEWKREFEENEISAGPRIWLLCSGDRIKVIKRNHESQMQKKKQNREGSDYFILNFSRQWSQAIPYSSVLNLPCLSFFPCSSAELPQFLLDLLLAVSSPQGSFCLTRTDKAHWWSLCTFFHFYFFPIQTVDLFPALRLGRNGTGVTQMLNDSFLGHVHLTWDSSN